MSDIDNLKQFKKLGWKYLVNFVIDVKRTDNKMLDNDEKAMVQEMRMATEQAISIVMHKHGHKNSKRLGSKMKSY